MLREVGKLLCKPLLLRPAVSNGFQRRGIHPICGPPKYPLTGAEHWYLGGGFLLTIMLLPTWGLYNVPYYVEVHNKTAEDADE